MFRLMFGKGKVKSMMSHKWTEKLVQVTIKYREPDNWLGQEANVSYWFIFSCRWKMMNVGGLCAICSQTEFFLVSTAFITLHTADRTVMSQQDAAEKQVKANIDVFLHLTAKPQRKEKVWSFTSFQSVKSRLSHYISQTFVLVRKQI